MKSIKINYIIPNVITCINMLLGFMSIIKSMQGEYLVAAWLILIALIADGMDGKAARILNGFSEFGKELDSFSDAISFGLAPGILIYQVLTKEGFSKEIVFLVSFLYVLNSVLRLARFNITTAPTKEKGDFMGMPTPTGAGLTSSFIVFSYTLIKIFNNSNIDISTSSPLLLGVFEIKGEMLLVPAFFLAMTIANSFFLISNITYKSIPKAFNLNTKWKIIIFAIVLFAYPPITLFLAGFTYFLVNNIRYFSNRILNKENPQ